MRNQEELELGRATKAQMYAPILVKIFMDHYQDGAEELHFARTEITAAARALDIKLPSNLGDLIYSFRYRRDYPKEILDRSPGDSTWIIMGAGIGKYKFLLGTWARIEPSEGHEQIKIFDATPEIIRRYADRSGKTKKKTDEQALLARIRYNRLVDTFLGITAYSLQNHLRTTVDDIGQIEVDELYVGVSDGGTQYVIPVQAKVDKDRHSVVQTLQDAAFCETQHPNLVRRCISAQFHRDRETIVMFELKVTGREVSIRKQRHYKLVRIGDFTDAEIASYRVDD